ncbi:MAG: LLM class flavin-dependent oxidoreductase [Actinomycetota bacterium]
MLPNSVVPEFSWFAALCDDDTSNLGQPSAQLLSSYDHCARIVAEAADQGFDAVLLPSGYALGIDATAFAAAIARDVPGIDLLLAIRCGELWTPQLVRQLSTIDQLSSGRLRINIISSDLPGRTEPGELRYERTARTMEALKAGLQGHLLQIDGTDLQPPRIASTVTRRPPLYFGGLSPAARQVAAEHADVYLMWPDTEEGVAEIVQDLTQRAASFGRTLKFGYRVHVVVRPTEAEARAAAFALVADLDDVTGDAIRSKSLDATSVGVARQGELREASNDDGFIEPTLWTGIGRARSGCGAAIVGDPDQVEAKLRSYLDLGISAFILSGYPHEQEARHVGQLVLPRFAHGKLSLS